MKTYGFVAVVEAEPGSFLLGETTFEESKPFHFLPNAERWAAIVASLNREAGRKVSQVQIRIVLLAAEEAFLPTLVSQVF